MTGNRDCTVYVGNLDEKVTDRILYEILVQAGRIVDLHIPRDKDTNRPKGFAFVEFETMEIAEYAVKLFSGLVTLYSRTLKFGISGQDKSTQKVSTQNTPIMNSVPTVRPHALQTSHIDIPQRTCRNSAYQSNYAQEPSPLGYRSNLSGNAYDYDRRVYGATPSSSHRPHESRNPITYNSY
ncbi:hypothetical protein ACHQM5_016617 [Ranunculus cassubicifolius]